MIDKIRGPQLIIGRRLVTHNASFMLTNKDLDSAVYALRKLHESDRVEASRATSKEESEMLACSAAGWLEIADRVEAIAERRFFANVEVKR
jgi:predicted MarR family transcription regulator